MYDEGKRDYRRGRKSRKIFVFKNMYFYIYIFFEYESFFGMGCFIENKDTQTANRSLIYKITQNYR